MARNKFKSCSKMKKIYLHNIINKLINHRKFIKQKKNPVFASSQITVSFALTTRQSSFLVVCSRVCVYEQNGFVSQISCSFAQISHI